MTRINTAVATLLFLYTFAVAADEVEIVLDASGAMARPGIGDVPVAVNVGEALVAVAAEAAAEPSLRIGLRLAGGDPAATSVDSCAAASLPVPVSEVTLDTWTTAIDAVRPAGFRPLIASVLAALGDLEPLPGDRRIVVVTSGVDECWLSPRKIAAALAASDRPPGLRIVGLGLDEEIIDSFGAIPTRNATSPQELLAALRWAVLDADTDERPTGVLALSLETDENAQPQARVGIDDLATGSTRSEVIQGQAAFDLPVGRYRLTAETADGKIHEFREVTVRAGVDNAARLDLSPLPSMFIDVIPNPAVSRGWVRAELLGSAPPDTHLVFGGESGRLVSPRWTLDPTGVWIIAPPFEGEFKLLLVGQAGDGARRVLARQPVSVVAAETEIQAPEEAGPGDTLTVSWTGINAHGDYVSLVPREGAGTDTIVCADAGPKGELRFAPTALEGEFDFIYVAGDTSTIAARIPVTISGPTATLSAPESVEVGARIEVAWEGPERDEDFVCLTGADAPDDDYTAWARVADGNPVVLSAPMRPGDFELRYIDGEDGTVWARAPIVVTGIPATIEAPPAATAGLRFEVHWTGPAARGDFLTIAKPNASADNYRDWASTTIGSPVTLAAPLRPGSYEVRYVTGSGREVLARSPIEIQP